jgi:DNA invertase Pin-like site-specific DNA recombinase
MDAENHRLMHALAVTARSGGLALPACINSYIYLRPVNHARLGFCDHPGEAMLVGYMRVSTSEQNLALQRDALEGAGCERLYEDTCSGSVTERPGLARALDNLRRGDALVVWKLDRIGRSLGHVVELVAGGLQAKGIGLKVLTGGIDTTSSTGRLVFGIFATLAEFERDLIKERTMAGLAAARARGRTGGRPRMMTRAKLRTAMTMMADQGNAASDVAEQLGISVSTLYAYVNGEGQAKPRAQKLLSR